MFFFTCGIAQKSTIRLFALLGGGGGGDGGGLAGTNGADGAVVPAQEQQHHHCHTQPHRHRHRDLGTHTHNSAMGSVPPIVFSKKNSSGPLIMLLKNFEHVFNIAEKYRVQSSTFSL